jgi:hypothetical protein
MEPETSTAMEDALVPLNALNPRLLLGQGL